MAEVKIHKVATDSGALAWFFFLHIPSLFLDLKEKQIPDLQIKAMYTFQRLRTNC